MTIETDKAKLEDCVALALQKAKALGATQSEVVASADEGLIASVRRGDVETVEFTKNHGFAITLYQGKSKGSSGTTDLTPEAINAAVEAAWDIAQHTSEDPYSGLADADKMATRLFDLDLDHPWQLQPNDAIEMATACEAAGLNLAGITNSEGATVSTGRGARVYGNSHGFVNSTLGTQHGLACALIAGEGDHMQRDFWSTRHRVPSLLDSPESVGREAGRRALARMNPRKVATGHYPVLFSAPLAAGLIGHLLSAVAGGNLFRKSSFLVDKLNQKVAASALSVYEEPHLPQGASSACCDGDGLPTFSKHFVSDGVLVNYMLGTYSARRLGMTSTANVGGARNVRTSQSDSDYEAIIKTMGKGLIVTELMGQGVNLVTGDYSRGAAGFWVENGEIQFPVQEITIAGNLADMFNQIAIIGADTDRRGNIQTGSILIDSMMLAGSD